MPPSPEPTRDLSRPLALALLALVVAGSVAVSVWLIAQWPTVYWFDGYNRLAHRGDLVVWRWLPLLQSVILVTSELASGPDAVRIVLALIATGTICAAYALCARLFDRWTGLIAALWVASNALFLVFATIPYQEPLFAAQVLAVLALAHRPAPERGPAPAPDRARLVLLAVMVHLACLNRYEGWGLALVAALEAGLRTWRPRGAVRALWSAFGIFLAFGGVLIAGWLAFAPIELMQHETAITGRLNPADQLAILRKLGGELWRECGPVLCLLGPLGALAALGDRAARTTHLRLAAFLAPYIGLILMTDPLGTQRLAFLFMVLLVLGAARAIVLLARGLGRRSSSPSARGLVHAALAVLVLAVAVTGARRGTDRVGFHATVEPDRVRVQRATTWLRPRLSESAFLIVCNERERRVASTHAWIPLERVLNGARMPELAATDLRDLLERADRVHLVLTDEPVEILAAALPALVEGAGAAGLVIEQVPPGSLPMRSAEIWTARLP